MRDFLISVTCILVLIVTFSLYHAYSHTATDCYSKTIDSEILPAVEEGSWDEAEEDFIKLYDRWESNRRVFTFFLSNRDLGEIDSTFEKTYWYIRMHDNSNASGELAALKTELEFLHENEALSLNTVF